MKKLFTLLSLIALTSFGQTIKFPQIERAAGAGRYIITNPSGVMTYTTSIPASAVSGFAATSPLFLTGTTFSIQPASTSQDGYVSAAAYTTFNNKGDALTSNPLSQFASTTSSQLAGVISNESGSGSLIFGTAPTFSTSTNYAYATANTIGIFDGSNNLVSANTTTYPSLTELSYSKGVTSAIQTQLSAKESALTFSTGLTRSTNTITNNLSVGVSGGQTVIGGTAVGDGLTFKGTTGNGTATAAAYNWTIGNNGATTGMQMYNNGVLNIGSIASTNANYFLQVQPASGNTIPFLIGKYSSETNSWGMWAQTTALASTSNYAMYANASQTNVGAGSGGTVNLVIAGSGVFQVAPSAAKVAGTLSVSDVMFASNTRATIYTSAATATYCKFGNTNTGIATTDGFDIGVSSTGVGEIRQRENLGIELYTNNTLRATWAAAGTLTLASDLVLGTVGNGLYIKEGTNATMGTATLTAGTVVVSTTKVTANSRIFLTVNGGTLTNVGAVYISARTAGTSFTITSANVLDASNVAWMIVEPN